MNIEFFKAQTAEQKQAVNLFLERYNVQGEPAYQPGLLYTLINQLNRIIRKEYNDALPMD